MESNKHVYDATLDSSSDPKTFFASSSLVTATGFFRLRELYKSLVSSVLPEFTKHPVLNIWSAGCSDGREPYSIALEVQRWIDQHPEGHTRTFNLRASDITHEMIQTGLSNQYEVGGSEIDSLKEYADYITFLSPSLISINPAVKRKILFAEEDIRKHKNPKKYHLLICTNVLFYYEMEYRKQMVAELVQNLHPDGVIYLESMGSRFMRSLGLERINPGNHFFRIRLGA